MFDADAALQVFRQFGRYLLGKPILPPLSLYKCNGEAKKN